VIPLPRRKGDTAPYPRGELTKIVGRLSKQQRDLGRVKEPIHQIFVNWHSDAAGIVKFTEKYGLLDDCAQHGGEVFDGYGCKLFDVEDGTFDFDLTVWRSKQENLRRLWEMNGKCAPEVLAELSLLFDTKSIGFVGDPRWFRPQEGLDSRKPAGPELLWAQKRGRLTLEIQAKSLYRYMCFLVMIERLGSLRYCENPECTSPRFRARRNDQVFCSADCAQLIAKRRWWAEHGKEWRQKRKATKKSKTTRGKL
jgi:hypothetical protein